MSTEKGPPAPAANDEQSALATLKSLLLGPEQSTIERLQQEARSPEVQTRRLAENLPDSLHRAYRDSPTALAKALEAPVSECIEDSVQRNPTFFADILYPVMGPAIRRSIGQALKGLVQQINQTLEHSLTPTGLKWRIQAARTGVPFGEIVLRNSLRYRVEEVFLIQNGSGLLIQHLGQGRVQDADAVSAMLTAIRDFAHDTMEPGDADTRLETVDIGQHTLWLVHGPRAYLACAIRGLPPVGLREDLEQILSEIHRRQGGVLEDFDGNQAAAAALVPLLEPCLRSEMARQAGKRFPWPLVLILLALAGATGWWGYIQWQQHERAAQSAALQRAGVVRLAEAPGIVLTDWRIEDGLLRLSGLHDPLTPTPQELLTTAGLGTEAYRLDFRSFQSSDRVTALARAQRRLAPPEGVQLALDSQGTLSASGAAATSWIERAALLANTVPGVERFDSHALESLDQLLQRRLSALLQPPVSVTIKVREGVADIAGQAPLAWIRSLQAAEPQLAGLRGLDDSRLSSLEAQRLERLVALIEGTTVEFVSGVDLGSAQLDVIASLASLISEANQLAGQLERDMQLQIIGRTDGTGSPEQNHFVARERALRVAEALKDSGFELPAFSLLTITQPPDRPQPDIELRRVEFRLPGLTNDGRGDSGRD